MSDTDTGEPGSPATVQARRRGVDPSHRWIYLFDDPGLFCVECCVYDDEPDAKQPCDGQERADQ